MRKSKTRFEEGFLELPGAASGFDEPEFAHGEDAIGGVGLSVGAVRSAARRQLVGSIVVALVITGAAGIAALKRIHGVEPTGLTHRFAVVRQPTFEALPNHRIAATKRNIEVP